MAQTSQQSSPASDASDAAADTDLKRGLSARHMQMIAIGGAIGTGLFVASGKTISTAGPGFKPTQHVTFHHPSGLPWGGTTGLTGQSPSRPNS